jgi:hypothetical protein
VGKFKVGLFLDFNLIEVRLERDLFKILGTETCRLSHIR